MFMKYLWNVCGGCLWGCLCGVCVCVWVWCGVCVWCGVFVWCVCVGVVWCGVVWCGVVWCGVVWCGVCGCVVCGGREECGGGFRFRTLGEDIRTSSLNSICPTSTLGLYFSGLSNVFFSFACVVRTQATIELYTSLATPQLHPLIHSATPLSGGASTLAFTSQLRTFQGS